MSAKRQRLLDGSGAVTAMAINTRKPVDVYQMDDFETIVAQQGERTVSKRASDQEIRAQAEARLVEAVEHASRHMLNAMTSCGYTLPFEMHHDDQDQFTDEADADLAARTNDMLIRADADIHLADAEFALRNAFTLETSRLKYSPRDRIDGEPPLVSAQYHNDFLTIPHEEWHRACCFGKRCEGMQIETFGHVLREFLLPDENEELVSSVMQQTEYKFPQRDPVCLLCDRRITHEFAVYRDEKHPKFMFEESVSEDDDRSVYLVNGFPLIINIQHVEYDRPGEYRGDRIVRAQDPGEAIPGICGSILIYCRTDYISDKTEDGVPCLRQDNLLFQ